MKAIVNGKLILKDRIVDGEVLIFDEKVAAIQDDITGFSDLEIFDAKGCYVSPGFIDIHTHGAFGHDAMDGDSTSLEAICKGLPESGVTSFLPTTITMEWGKIQKALANLRNHMNMHESGARVLGAHLEGPFINPVRKGAHDEAYIVRPDFDKIKDYLDVIKIITIAPEMDGGMEFIRKMKSHQCVSLSIGHSDATYEDAESAIKAGIKSATHLYNAMSGLNHRSPGVVGAALDSGIYCELIADNIHVHSAAYKIAALVKGSDKLILITDAIRASCMREGVYELGGQSVTVQNGSARLQNGTLAGSVLRMNQAVRNLRQNTEFSLQDAVKTASFNPAALIGLDKELGSIETGKRADFTIFNEDIDILATIIDGELCFSRM